MKTTLFTSGGYIPFGTCVSADTWEENSSVRTSLSLEPFKRHEPQEGPLLRRAAIYFSNKHTAERGRVKLRGLSKCFFSNNRFEMDTNPNLCLCRDHSSPSCVNEAKGSFRTTIKAPAHTTHQELIKSKFNSFEHFNLPLCSFLQLFSPNWSIKLQPLIKPLITFFLKLEIACLMARWWQNSIQP